MYESPWSGPHQAQTAALRGQPAKAKRSYQPKSGRANAGDGHGMSGHSHSSASRTADTWYDKVLNSLGHDKPYEPSGSSSQDELARTEAAMPPRLELGAIYKTTDVHVSTQDAPRQESEPDLQRRDMSFQEMLNQER